MKNLTITEAKIEAVDCRYAAEEYGATPQELERFERAVDQHFAASKKAGRLMTLEQVERARR